MRVQPSEASSSTLVQAMNYANQASSSTFEDDTSKQDNCSYLLFYDLYYSEQKQTDNNKNNKESKKNKSSRQDLYSDSDFLINVLYDNYGVAVIEDSSADADSIEDPVELHPPANTSAVKFVPENCMPSIQRPLDAIDETLEPVLVQCLELPEKLRKNMVVTALHPTKDGHHLMVTLGVPQTKEAIVAEYQGVAVEDCQLPSLINSIHSSIQSMLVDSEKNGWTGLGNYDGGPNLVVYDGKSTFTHSSPFSKEIKMLSKFDELPKAPQISQEQQCDANFIYSNVEQQPCGAVLLYALEGGDTIVSEQPLLWRFLSSAPLETLLLPHSEKEGDGEVKSKEPQGLAAVVCRDGAVRVLDIASLSTVATAKPSQMNAKFVSATYCNSRSISHFVTSFVLNFVFCFNRFRATLFVLRCWKTSLLHVGCAWC
jgi:hypothetical protein